MKAKTEGQPVFKAFSEFPEYRLLEEQYEQLGQEKTRLDNRQVELRAKVNATSETPNIIRKAKNLIAAITGGKEALPVEEDRETLFAELREVQDRIATLPQAFQLLSRQMEEMRSRLSPGICVELQAADRDAVHEMAKDLLSFAQRCTRRMQLIQALDSAGVRFASYIEPFGLHQFDVDEPYSIANMRLREMIAYSGQSLEGWEDPIFAREPKASDPRKIELLGTQAGPEGVKFRGQTIISPFADFLVKSGQARELSIAARRAKLDRLSA